MTVTAEDGEYPQFSSPAEAGVGDYVAFEWVDPRGVSDPARVQMQRVVRTTPTMLVTRNQKFHRRTLRGRGTPWRLIDRPQEEIEEMLRKAAALTETRRAAKQVQRHLQDVQTALVRRHLRGEQTRGEDEWQEILTAAEYVRDLVMSTTPT